MKKTQTTAKNHKRYQREAILLSTITHDNIIKVYDYEIKDDCVTIIMEYCENSLSKYFERSIYPINKTNLKTMISMLIKAINELHHQNLIYRNIKPQHFLINNQGVLKMCDLSNVISTKTKSTDGLSQNDDMPLWYKPPEVLFGDKEISVRLDMWGIGCI